MGNISPLYFFSFIIIFFYNSFDSVLLCKHMYYPNKPVQVCKLTWFAFQRIRCKSRLFNSQEISITRIGIKIPQPKLSQKILETIWSLGEFNINSKTQYMFFILFTVVFSIIISFTIALSPIYRFKTIWIPYERPNILTLFGCLNSQ